MLPEDRLDLMMLYAAGALDADEAAAVRVAIASGDPATLAALAEAEAVLAQLPEALPEVEAPARVRQQLRERIQAHAASQTIAHQSPPTQATPPRSAGGPAGWVPWLAAAAVAALACTATWWLMSQQALDQRQTIAELRSDMVNLESDLAAARTQAEQAREVIRVRQQEAEAAGQKIASLEQANQRLEQRLADAEQAGQTSQQQLATLREDLDRVASRLAEVQRQTETERRVLAALRAPSSRAVSLAGTENQDGATGRLIYDAQERASVLLTQNMQAAPEGQTYQLWVVTEDERKVSVGTFDVGPDGRGTLIVDLPEDPGPVTLAAVTNEPLGGSPQPTGQFQMLGEF